ncbi:hypothetical protein N398_s2gp1 [Ustilaginoidea virens partitivirus 2]|uniref:hypothetical protein n=1 Tax=Ustilaginoidea virens partitivirus 2 TaxID=1415665 RepID=UPI00035AB373|nr:hypothetical protein N398_s2gp1 [Ustilaginoidea virens partitivirus 2]AGR45852.1 hypothetical protein [Ustilaginoidea virens partitivirus 2]
MKNEIAFQPGKFSPVIEVSQRQSGVPAPADTSFDGLEEVALTTLQVATSSARGSGAVIQDSVPLSKLSMVIGYLLAARNIAEQLLFIGVSTRMSTPLRAPNGNFLEPIVRAYNFYGHFEHESKTFVTRGLETLFIRYLFGLRQFATTGVSDGSAHTVRVLSNQNHNFSDIDLDFYYLSEAGEIAFGKRYPLKEYLIHLVKYASDFGDVDERIPLLQRILDVTTEDGLNQFLRYARRLPDWQTPPREFTPDPSDKHKSAMKELFGAAYSTAGQSIPVSKFTESINLAYALLRRVSLERQYGMKTVQIPRYEGGSPSQMASYQDDVLFSTIPLSLADSTAAVGFTTSYGSLARYTSAPGFEKDELVRELVSQSLVLR